MQLLLLAAEAPTHILSFLLKLARLHRDAIRSSNRATAAGKYAPVGEVTEVAAQLPIAWPLEVL